jgi:hypothetical protein
VTAVARTTGASAAGAAPTMTATPVAELPITVGGPGNGSGKTALWLLVALLALSGLAIAGVRAWRPRWATPTSTPLTRLAPR